MSEEPIILGQQLAAARKAEEARLATGDAGPSPLGGKAYDRWNGGLDLDDPAPTPLDERISALCREYVQADPAVRSAMRRSLSMDDFYTLLAFGRRAGVFGLRTRDTRWLADGLTSSAMIEIDRIDWRDACWFAGVIYAIFHQLGIDSKPGFAAASALAAPEMAKVLESFQTRPPGQEQITDWGYRFVDSPGGPGLIASWGKPYHPTMPLDRMILQIARLLGDDKYAPEVRVASDLRDVWLSGIDDAALAGALESAVAAASASGVMRPAAGSDNYAQDLSVSLVETSSEEAAATLSRLAREKRARPRNFSLLAARRGRLFCLLIARSTYVGVASCETDDTIARFLPGIEGILRSYPEESGPRSVGGWLARILRALADRRLGGHGGP